MSRDAYDDERYDDGGGDGRRDDGYDDGGGGGRRGSVLAIAKGKVGTSGMMLMMFGIFSLFLALLTVATMAVVPDTVLKPLYDFQADALKKNPNNQQVLPPYEEFKSAQIMQYLIGGTINLIASIPIVIGAMRMRSLNSYGLAMTATILSMIPCTNSCCCIGLPLGIWALIVLLNADVKEGFRLTAQRATGY